MKLSLLSPDDMPREKLRAKGPEALSNADLVAIILRTGTGKKNVLELARELLAANGNRLAELARQTQDKLVEFNGIGIDKAATLAAVFELVRRIMAEEPQRDVPIISDARKAYLFMEPRMKDLDHEECWLIYLNRSLRLIGAERLTSGTPVATGVDVQMIIAKTLARKASKIIMLHNHPYSAPTPGEHDLEFTMILKSALQPIGLRLLDHIIIGDGGFFSFSEENIIRGRRSIYTKNTREKSA